MKYFEKELQQMMLPRVLMGVDKNHEDEGLFTPSYMMVVSELNSIHGWSDEEAIKRLKESTEDAPLELRNGVLIWSELQ